MNPSTRTLLTRLLRAYIRHAPFDVAKKALWARVIDPYFAWHRHEFVARTIFGCRLEGDTRDILQQYVYYFGVWEPQLTSWIARRIRPGDTFVDVGANVGYFTLLASKLVGRSGAVVAVEPSPRLFSKLCDGLTRNRVENVRALNAAALDRCATVPLYRGTEHHSGLTTTRPERGLEFECEVEAAPLAAVLRREEIESARLVKIDVEGAEWSVVSGMEPLLREGRRDLEVVIEIDPALLAEQGRRVEDLLQLFAVHGFHAYRIENDYSAESYIESRRQEVAPQRLRTSIAGVSDVIFSREDTEAL